MKRTWMMAALSATAVLAGTGAARAQRVLPVLTQVAPGVYAPSSSAGPTMVQVAPGVFSPVPVNTMQVAPGVYAQAPAPPPPQAFTARISGSFVLTPVDEVAVSDTLTRSTYSANGATIVLTPSDVPGAPLRLTGRLAVETETTTDAEGNGTISGTLTFTGQSTTGMVADLLTLHLQGAYGKDAAPLRVTGDLNIPAATDYERPIYASITGTLSSDASLSASLGGLAAVQIP